MLPRVEAAVTNSRPKPSWSRGGETEGLNRETHQDTFAVMDFGVGHGLSAGDAPFGERRSRYCAVSFGAPAGHCGTAPQYPSQNLLPTRCSQPTRVKKSSRWHCAMASAICCHRFG